MYNSELNCLFVEQGLMVTKKANYFSMYRRKSFKHSTCP